MADEKTTKTPTPDPEGAAKRVQEQIDKETDQGFRGTETDPTPNENYTVDGVTAGKPTPETDPEAAAAAKAQLHKGIE